MRSTHSIVLTSMMLVSISLINAEQDFDLIIAFVEFVVSSIHLISAICLLSYDCLRHIRSIIKRFSLIMSSLTKQSYRNFEFVQKINDKELFNLRIRSIVDLMIESTSKSFVIAYNSVARTLLITRLHLVNDQ